MLCTQLKLCALVDLHGIIGWSVHPETLDNKGHQTKISDDAEHRVERTVTQKSENC